jgi:uncharacterized protein (TIGR03437 family)
MQVVTGKGYYAPGLVSVYQINFIVGPNVQTGNRSLNVAIGGTFSERVLLPVRR